jgi:hypothetical protein
VPKVFGFNLSATRAARSSSMNARSPMGSASRRRNPHDGLSCHAWKARNNASSSGLGSVTSCGAGGAVPPRNSWHALKVTASNTLSARFLVPQAPEAEPLLVLLRSLNRKRRSERDGPVFRRTPLRSASPRSRRDAKSLEWRTLTRRVTQIVRAERRRRVSRRASRLAKLAAPTSAGGRRLGQ